MPGEQGSKSYTALQTKAKVDAMSFRFCAQPATPKLSAGPLGVCGSSVNH
jgi:hypothetical protein